MTKEIYTWTAVAAIVTASCAGDVLLSHAMKQIGDVGELSRRAGLLRLLTRVLRNPWFLFGIVCMALAFYSLLFALSWNDLSLIGPAAAALTFVGNAIAAKLFLHERVDSRRWVAVVLVAGGVMLLAR